MSNSKQMLNPCGTIKVIVTWSHGHI